MHKIITVVSFYVASHFLFYFIFYISHVISCFPYDFMFSVSSHNSVHNADIIYYCNINSAAAGIKIYAPMPHHKMRYDI